MQYRYMYSVAIYRPVVWVPCAAIGLLLAIIIAVTAFF